MKTSNRPLINREGFWASDEETHLPTPVPTSWKNRKTFLQLLAKAQTKAHEVGYKGSSTCRICDKTNGSTEFKLNFRKSIWVWPSGFRHYIEEHKIRPSLAFEEFINEVCKNTIK